MSFQFLIDPDLTITGLPSPSGFNSIGIKTIRGSGASCFVNPKKISNGGNWSLRTAFIQTAVDNAINGGQTGLTFDEENAAAYADPRSWYGDSWVWGQADSDVDICLNAFQAAYDYAKNYATTQGHPSLLIGFYNFPSTFHGEDGYYMPLYYYQSPTGTQWMNYWGGTGNNTVWYNLYIQIQQRCNYRWNGSGYTYTPFRVDYLSRAAYSAYGNDKNAMLQWSQSNSVSTNATKVAFPQLNNYPHIEPMHHISTYSRFIALDANAMQVSIDTIRNNGGDGIILWAGWFPSYTFIDYIFTPAPRSTLLSDTDTTVLNNWKTVISGSFKIQVCYQSFTITGINTSAATSMSNVASILQSAIQSQMAGVFNLSVVDQAFETNYPVGNVLVTWVWSATNILYRGFLFNVQNNGSNSPQPPNWSRTVFGFATGPSGTDLSNTNYIGLSGINSSASPGNLNWIYGNTSPRNQNEYTEWFENGPWWQVFKSEAAGRGIVAIQSSSGNSYAIGV